MKQYYITEFSDPRGTKVITIPILADNYVYVLTDNSKKAFIVDPGDADPVIKVIKSLQLMPEFLLITHSHHDHIAGVSNIQEAFPQIKKFDFSNSSDDRKIFQIADRQFEVFKTPGHWPDHICFYEVKNKILFCGDILFRFGCGRIFDGTFKELFQSLQRIKKFPADTQMFCTHEYTQQNLAFCVKYNLVNPELFSDEIKNGIANYPTLPVQLGAELNYNPFLRAPNLEKLTELRILRNSFKFEVKVET